MDRWAGTDREYDRWAESGRDYDGHGRLPGYARRPMVRWVGLLIAWVIVTGLLAAVHLAVLIWVIMAGLIAYVVYCILRDTPRTARRRRRHATADTASSADFADDSSEQFNAPPGWPEPPPGWTPPPGWQPNPSWPSAPPGWQFWLPPDRQDFGERTARIRRRHRSESDGHRSTDFWA